MAATKSKKAPSRRRRPVSSFNRAPIDRLGTRKLTSPDEVIFRRGQAARNIYKVESGCVRTFIHHGRGRRLIVALYFPGDYFGLEAGKKHSVAAAAVTTSTILRIGKGALRARAASDAGAASTMLKITNLELQRAREHALVLRVGAASERVGQFLVDMKARHQSKEVDLVMSRQDIADYLNLTIELVARALTQLESTAAISRRTRRRIAVNLPRRKTA